MSPTLNRSLGIWRATAGYTRRGVAGRPSDTIRLAARATRKETQSREDESRRRVDPCSRARRGGVATADPLPCAVAQSSRIAPDRAGAERLITKKRFLGERFARTELFFGSARPAGEVSEAEFKQFLDECVTPRFPDGLTLVTGLGQFRGANGLPVEERAMLLILLYPDETRKANSLLIEEIREAYKQIFEQESVLRADRCCEQIGF